MGHDQDHRDVVRELEAWRETRAHEPGYGIYYMFSAEWEQLCNRDWSRYDELDAQRCSLNIPRLEWQDSMDAARSLETKTRNESYKAMNDRLWKICPLSVHLNRYHRRPDLDPKRRTTGWSFVISDLEDFGRLFKEGDFRRTLSPSQKRSFELIAAWWSAAYCDPDLLTAVREFIRARAGKIYTNNPTSQEALEAASRPAKTGFSYYHSALYDLLLREFHPQAWEPYICGLDLYLLQSARYRAGCLAASQKLSYSYWRLYNMEDRPPAVYPQVLLNDHPASQDWSQTARPFYLWDTMVECTVEVSSLPDCPEYVCISHTWGRFRTGTDADIPHVPWKVPENTRFDVKTLPRQLKLLGSAYVWFDLLCIPQDDNNVERANIEIGNQAAIFRRSARCIGWINDVDSWHAVETALRWLGLKWLKITSLLRTNDIDDRISAATMDRTPTHLELFRAMKGTELPNTIARPDNRSGSVLLTPGEPATWFSSLWTLQECVLCPDMELYTKNWQCLEDGWGNPIPLRALMVFIRETWNCCWLQERIDTLFYDPRAYETAIINHPLRGVLLPAWSPPNGVGQLMSFCAMTRLDNVLTTGSPTTVLTNANIRQSTSSRAPAIMSALGVTDWYKNVHPNGVLLKHLVFGMYPLEFLREAARRFGAIFYESTASKVTNVRLRDLLSQNHGLGTMLPFKRRLGWFCGVAGSYEHTYIEIIDHGAVPTWNICSDGTVDLPNVGIAFESDQTRKIVGSVLLLKPEEDQANAQGVFRSEYVADICQRLRELDGKSKIIGVALYEDCRAQHGCLLQKVRYPFARGKTCFIKIGSYITRDEPMPQNTPVNWKVL
ncbi:hypothetical protein F4782DRAFT_26628 [Xylaria castorea]|nr:hypothetical protein F4782DRAFT_26628 [Xylaria castorea]